MAQTSITSAIILISTASFSGVGSKSGDVHAIKDKILGSGAEAVDIVHALIGPNDLLAHVHGADLDGVIEVIDTHFQTLKQDSHNYIAQTETLLVRQAFGKQLSRADDDHPEGVAAWVFANTNALDPDIFGNLVTQDDRLAYAAALIGRFDMALFIKAKDQPDLMDAIDQTLRTKNFFIQTDTRIVLM